MIYNKTGDLIDTNDEPAPSQEPALMECVKMLLEQAGVFDAFMLELKASTPETFDIIATVKKVLAGSDKPVNIEDKKRTIELSAEISRLVKEKTEVETEQNEIEAGILIAKFANKN